VGNAESGVIHYSEIPPRREPNARSGMQREAAGREGEEPNGYCLSPIAHRVIADPKSPNEQ
jgi:hypothetical protein